MKLAGTIAIVTGASADIGCATGPRDGVGGSARRVGRSGGRDQGSRVARRRRRAILHALSAARPKARYVLGPAQGMNVLALLLLRLRDRIARAIRLLA